MDDAPEYFEPLDIVLSNIRFRYEGGIYTGRGLLSWRPDEGFGLEAFVDRDGPLPSVIQMGKIGLVPPSGQTSIRFKADWYSWGYIPPFVLHDRLDVIREKRLSQRFSAAYFGRRLPAHHEQSVQGTLLLRAPSWPAGPDWVKVERRLADELIGQRSTRGLSHDDASGLGLRGEWPRRDVLELRWRLPFTKCNRARAWPITRACVDAFAMLCGGEVQLLRAEVTQGLKQTIWMAKTKPLQALSPYELLRDQDVIDREWLTNLILFFEQTSDESRVARELVKLILDASRQRSIHAKELLFSVGLEAVLRTLSGPPAAVKGSKPFKLEPAMIRFRERYLSANWEKLCDKALAAFHRVRHRNAHPDWSVLEGGSMSPREREQSLDDLILLAAFYGQMILAMAGVPNMQPRSPKPHREWGPVITITTGKTSLPPNTEVISTNEKSPSEPGAVSGE